MPMRGRVERAEERRARVGVLEQHLVEHEDHVLRALLDGRDQGGWGAAGGELADGVAGMRRCDHDEAVAWRAAR